MVLTIDGEPWFVARDVCDVLGIERAADAVRRLDEDEYQQVAATTVSTAARPGVGPQTLTVVNESGLYSLVLGSRKPEAREFKRWVTREVLPSIRKTGSYVAPAMSALDAIQAMVDQLRVQDAAIRELADGQRGHDRAILELGSRTEQLEASYERVAGTGYAHLRGLRSDVAYLNRLGRAAAAIGRRDGIPFEKVHSTIFGQVNAWPVEVWDEALDQVGR
jgi:prophage antirepressor-like protein